MTVLASATPFDTGGLNNGRIRTVPPLLTPAARRDFVQASNVGLPEWRHAFAEWLASYFRHVREYWTERPWRLAPDRIYELNDDWQAWVWEVRFSEPQPMLDVIMWSAPDDRIATIREALFNAAGSLTNTAARQQVLQFLHRFVVTGPDLFDDFEGLIRGLCGVTDNG